MKISPVLKVSLLGLALFLTSCGSSSELGDPLTRDYSTVNGEFKSLGNIRVNGTVTHLFEEDDGTILYAYSDRYDLNENLNTRVEAYGVLTTYETLDKPLFEVKRVGTATDETVTEEEVTDVNYKNGDLGVSFTYPSNWTVKSEDGTETSLEAPLVPLEDGTVDEEEGTQMEATEITRQTSDQIEVVQLPAVFTRTENGDEGQLTADIKSYVSVHFVVLAGVNGEATYVGADHMQGVRYKPTSGDLYVFVARDAQLFELHYAHLSDDADLRIEHANVFTNLVSSFRFIPVGEVTEDDASVTDESNAVDETTTTTSDDVTAPTVDQVTVSKWTTLSSNFNFSMQIPSAWYYVGGSTGYTFALEAIEDVNAQGIVTLSFNSSTTEGTQRGTAQVSITKKIDSRYYTLSGAPEYETAMRTMIDSIQTTKAE